jgi:hypothetical protein
MNNATIDGNRQPATETVGSLDHADPQEQMKAIHSALQQYFEAEDWLAERTRRFPGLR